MAAELLLVQSQLEKARQDLRHVEEGIKKTVRDPPYGFGDRLGGRGGRRGGMVRPQMRERQFVREESPPKHKISSVASRLGPVNVLKEPVKKYEEDEEEDEEEEETPTLKSTVIQGVGVTELTREAAVPVDKATVQRSRRLFGSLLMGTLNQFKADKVKTKEQEDKQAVVLDKIQKKEVEQKVQSAAERKKLFQCKDGVKDEIKLLEEQMTVTEMKVLCEAERDKLVQFIQTKASPPLFYLPKEHNKKTEAALKESTGRVTESYAVRVAEFDSKLSTLKSRIEEVQQTKDAIVPTLTTPLSKEKDPLQSKDKENGGQEDTKNKETGIKIEVQLRSKEENGHSKDDKKRRHSSASQRSEKEEKKDKKRRHSTESAASEKSAKEEKKDKKSKRRHSTTSEKSAKEEKVEVVTKSSSESESSSGESSAEEEKEKSPIKKSKKSPKKESKKSPRKESKSPRKRARRSSKGKEE